MTVLGAQPGHDGVLAALRSRHDANALDRASIAVMTTIAIVSWTWLASVVVFALAMSATPGPNNAMVTASGASWGFARTIPHMLGVAFGFPVMLLAVALGAGALLRASPVLQTTLQWIGAAYLVWLAIGIARAAPASTPGAGGRPLGFIRAALFQVVNPKAWLISIGASAAFTNAGDSALGQASLLAVVFAAVTLPCLAIWTALGVGAARLLRTPGKLRAFNVAMAALLVASLVPLLLGE